MPIKRRNKVRALVTDSDMRVADADLKIADGVLPARQLVIMTAIMPLLVGFILSGIFTYLERGLFRDFLLVWFERFWSTYLVVLPTVAFVGPLTRKLTAIVERRFLQPRQALSDRE